MTSDTHNNTGWLPNLGSYPLLNVVAVNLTIVGVLYVFYQRFLAPLARVPGPWLASITPLWRVYYIAQGDWHDKICDLHKRYGLYVRIAPNEVSTTSPAAVRVAYGHSGSPWVKDKWYQTWWADATLHPTFAETNVTRHRNQRRRVSKMYSMSFILGLQCHTDRVLERFFEQMRSLQGERIDMAEWTQYFAFDVLSELSFGDWFGNLDSASDKDELGHWVFLTLTGTAVLGWTWLQSAAIGFHPVQWLLNKSLYARAGTQITRNPLKEVLNRIIGKMRSGCLEKRDDHLVGHIQNIKNSDGSDILDRERMIEIANLVLAGGDTTAISLRAIMYHVSSNPRTCAKLQQEIDEAARAGMLSPIVTYQEAQQLPYFQLVIKEALRLYVAVGYQLPRVSPQGGATIDGLYIPGGAILSTNGWALHRNPEIYGPDCEEFKPERWLKKDVGPDKAKLMEECFASFGFGSRTCLGKNLALMEISRLIPTLYRDFNVDICYPQKPWVISSGWFAFSSNFYVRISSRER